jgi:hypothetical protein
MILKRAMPIRNKSLKQFPPFYFDENLRPYTLACNG